MIFLADGNANFGDVEIHAISSLLKLFLVLYCFSYRRIYMHALLSLIGE